MSKYLLSVPTQHAFSTYTTRLAESITKGHYNERHCSLDPKGTARASSRSRNPESGLLAKQLTLFHPSQTLTSYWIQAHGVSWYTCSLSLEILLCASQYVFGMWEHVDEDNAWIVPLLMYHQMALKS